MMAALGLPLPVLELDFGVFARISSSNGSRAEILVVRNWKHKRNMNEKLQRKAITMTNESSNKRRRTNETNKTTFHHSTPYQRIRQTIIVVLHVVLDLPGQCDNDAHLRLLNELSIFGTGHDTTQDLAVVQQTVRVLESENRTAVNQ
jgi:hypothetical protein